MGSVRREYGLYKRLLPVIEEMYIAGIPNGVIADVLDLDRAALTSRFHEWGLYEVREMHYRDLAKQIAEKHGVEPKGTA